MSSDLKLIIQKNYQKYLFKGAASFNKKRCYFKTFTVHKRVFSFIKLTAFDQLIIKYSL